MPTKQLQYIYVEEIRMQLIHNNIIIMETVMSIKTKAIKKSGASSSQHYYLKKKTMNRGWFGIVSGDEYNNKIMYGWMHSQDCISRKG